MAISLETLVLSKNYTKLVALGLSNVSIDNATGTVTFELNDGSTDSWTFPLPSDGKSITAVNINDANELVCTLSDGSTLSAGKLPISSNENGSSSSSEDISYTNTEHTAWTNVKKALDGIINKVYYVKPSITSFTATPSTTVYEKGQKISSLSFAWLTNKDITTQTLTGCTLADATVRSATYDTEISSNKSFVLSISDGENSDSKTFSVSFQDKIYYGSALEGTYDSNFILGLASKKFATSKSGTYSVNVANGQYGYIAYPKSFGQISSAKIGGFDTDLENCGDVSFTNSSGYTSTYNIVKTGRSGLGSISMIVS